MACLDCDGNDPTQEDQRLLQLISMALWAMSSINKKTGAKPADKDSLVDIIGPPPGIQHDEAGEGKV